MDSDSPQPTDASGSLASGPASTVYLGLGSNLNDRVELISAGVQALAREGGLENWCLSPLYETDPVLQPGSAPQPPYLNAVVRAETRLSPQRLLAACLDVEARFGRVRPSGIADAPRTLDIDILLYGDQTIETSTLTVPHPRLLVRPFVRIPLADVAAPGLVHPVTGVSLARAPASAGVRALVRRSSDR